MWTDMFSRPLRRLMTAGRRHLSISGIIFSPISQRPALLSILKDGKKPSPDYVHYLVFVFFFNDPAAQLKRGLLGSLGFGIIP
ncbi:hypothetical protein TNCT_310971 [Trichonephila clavata]|uniref:Uncharacterized protein n=1 Tax=Trichonephila clavata TaxID=2740835 RepID=A0A8X6LNB7_TRICU|nr:hypothetical protein TNCT_310971 [Trichonephila clavata]